MRGKALSTSMLLLAFLAVAAAPAAAQTPAPASPTAAVPAPAPAPPAATGGAAYGVVFQPTVPGLVAQIVNGVAYAPDQAPDQVKQAIWAANQIVGMPYRLGGGHKLGFTDHAYDCSGTVSFAMHGAGLLATPRDSSSFMRYGAARQGPVDHGLHQPRPRLRGHRGAAPGHERSRRPRRRLGPALAPEPALDARLQGPPPGRPVASCAL